MNCKKVKDLILCDYTDNELNFKIKSKVKKHLQNCNSCREFQEILQRKVISPLKNAKEIKPDSYLWQRIKEKIEIPVKADKKLNFSIFELLRQKLLSMPKPALTTIVGVAVIFFAVFLTRINFNEKRHINEYFTEQLDFLTYLNDNGQDIDFGSATERYFL